ncbi:MAG: hypothetical protein WCW54_01730 [Candidatus Paceibacterota bacterium]
MKMRETSPKEETEIESPKSKLQIEVDYFYSKWQRKETREMWNKLNKEEDSLYEQYNSKQESLYNKFPTEYQTMKFLEQEKDKLWSIFYDERARLEEKNPKADPLDIVETPSLDLLYQEYKKKRDKYDESYTILKHLISNFPEEIQDIKLTREKYMAASDSRSGFWEKYSTARDNFNNIYEEYESLNKDWFETIVNKFSLEINKYRRIKENNLKKRLNKITNLNLEDQEGSKSLIAKQLFIMEELASQFKKWTIRTTVLTFSVLALSWGIQKAKDEIKREQVKSKIDNLYKYAEAAPLDSVTEIILHDIAQDKELPQKWREFLAKEDSSEFFMNSLYEEYKNKKDEAMNDPDFENKLNYIVLLRMNEKYGKPKVEYGTAPHFHDRACYYQYANTMHLPTYTGHFSLSDYLAELSHAVQFKGPESEKYFAWNNKDVLKTDSISRKEKISYDEAQLKEYSDTSTLEYEAHEIIEPKLVKEFKKTKEDIIDELYNLK